MIHTTTPFFILSVLSIALSICTASIGLDRKKTADTQPKRALIWGITGQDGSYLTEFLLGKGYEVHGVIRRASSPNTDNIDHLLKDKRYKNRLKLHYGDLSDTGNTRSILQEVKPSEIFNLAAQSHVGISFEEPEYTAQVDGLGTLRILEAIRSLGMKDKVRFYQASTSELFGKVQEIPQKETTPFYPRSPYGVAKIYAYWATINYRESFGIYACNGILFNHESPRRGENFVTRKITKAAAARACGKKEVLALGNLDASRDWGYAGDYVEAMWLILQQPKPDDFVIATGKTYTVREFIEKTYEAIGHPIIWKGTGINEHGVDAKTGEVLVVIDPKHFRPAEVEYLVGDATKAQKALGWKPKTTLSELIKLMLDSDIEAEKKASKIESEEKNIRKKRADNKA